MHKEHKKELSLWVDKYTEGLYSWALHKLSNDKLAEDFVQDTFLAAAENLENFKRDSSPKTWLFSILNNKIIDYYRKKVSQPQQMENRPNQSLFDHNDNWNVNKRPKEWKEDHEEEFLDNAEFQQMLQKCLNALPDKWSLTVKLKYLMGKKGKVICKELGITPSNYWQMIHRAKLQLRNCVEKNWFCD